MRGLALAFSWLTVAPVRVDEVDRTVAAGALRWAPVVGLLLGAGAGGLAYGLVALGLPPLVPGLLAVGALALATRGMHLDGLADTADGLGCYGPPERALTVMRDGGAGPFAVVTLIVLLGVQAASLGMLAALGPSVVVAVALAAATGRAAFAWSCRRGVPAARPDGLGATGGRHAAGVGRPAVVAAAGRRRGAGAGVARARRRRRSGPCSPPGWRRTPPVASAGSPVTRSARRASSPPPRRWWC